MWPLACAGLPIRFGNYGEKPQDLVSNGDGDLVFGEDWFGLCADKHAGNDSDGKLRRLYVVRHKHRAKDNL